MRLPFLPLIIALCLAVSCTKNDGDTQPPIANNQAVTWSKTFGGTAYDFAYASRQLASGDYVFAGATRSSDGDLSGTRVGYDAWLVKVGSDGTRQWSVTFGNTTNDEYATGVAPTPDGGFIVTGYTFNTGSNTAWAVKANSSGGVVWEKQISTSNDAKPLAVIGTPDGGAVIAGYEKGTAGNLDGWLLKIDGNGADVWRKNFGGSSEDQLTSIVSTSDGGYALAGFSKSGDGDLTSNKGSFDAWILKVDASGNKTWSKSYGGSDADNLTGIALSPDGGFVTAGYTKSASGDITSNKGGNEAWILKLDASGNKVWSKNYGGANEEYITNIVATSGGYVIAGYTNSTTGDVTRTYNDFGGWLLKIDESGNKTGASTYGGLADDFTTSLIKTQDGGLMLTGYTDMASTGRGYDAWIVKIATF